jgi:hypothetical protein
MTGFTTVFGGSPVQASDVAYRAITLATSATLVWPVSNEDTTNVVARINDVTPGSGSLTITMPDATQVSVGQDALFTNTTGTAFTLLTSTGTTISAVAASQAVYIYLTDNSTAAGTWRATVFASTTTTANAAALAGGGLEAIASLLNVDFPVTGKSVNYTVVSTDRATTLVSTGGAITFDLTSSTTLGNGWMALISNQGTGALTIDPAGAQTIDGAATKTLNQTESCFIVADGGTAWFSVGFGQSITSSVTRLVTNAAGSGNLTLTTAEAASLLQEFTGALTGNRNIIVPTSAGSYHVTNSTTATGAFTFTVKTAAGTGIALSSGTRSILDCDGTNVVSAQSSTAGTVSSIGVGTGLSGSVNPITATGDISLANTAVTPGTYGSVSQVGQFAVDAQGRITSASGVTILATSIGGALATTAIITATTSGLSGGGSLAADRTLAVDIPSIAAITASQNNLGDVLMLQSVTATGLRKETKLNALSGMPIQTVAAETGAVATASVVIPADDTIPQITEGVEIVTATITPTNASSTLYITTTLMLFSSSAQEGAMALFQDAGVNALAAMGFVIPSANQGGPFTLTHKMTAGTTSATTFRVRAGPATAATFTVNGVAAARRYGGVASSSITVQEVLP